MAANYKRHPGQHHLRYFSINRRRRRQLAMAMAVGEWGQGGRLAQRGAAVHTKHIKINLITPQALPALRLWDWSRVCVSGLGGVLKAWHKLISNNIIHSLSHRGTRERGTRSGRQTRQQAAALGLGQDSTTGFFSGAPNQLKFNHKPQRAESGEWSEES